MLIALLAVSALFAVQTVRLSQSVPSVKASPELNVTLDGPIKLHVNETGSYHADFQVPTHNESRVYVDLSFPFFHSETVTVPDFKIGAVSWSMNGTSEAVFSSSGQTANLTFAVASEDVVQVSMNVTDSSGTLVGHAWTYVLDPYTLSNYYLTSVLSPANYVVMADGLGWYQAVNGTDGSVSLSDTNSTTVIRYALGALTTGRTWKETVKLTGYFPLTGDAYVGKIAVANYTILDLTDATLFLANGGNSNLIDNSDGTNGNTQIEIIGGILDGNLANQAPAPPIGNGKGAAISFIKVSNSSISGTTIRNPYVYGVIIDSGWGNKISNVNIFSSGYDGILLANTLSNQIIGCNVQNAGSLGIDGDGIGIYEASQRNMVDSCHVIDSYGDNFGIASELGQNPVLNVISNCESYGGRIGFAVFAGLTGGNPQQNSLSNIQSTAASDYAIRIHEAYFTTVTSFQTYFNGKYGIYIDSATSAFSATISQGYIYNPSQGGNYEGILIDNYTRVTIGDVTVLDNTAHMNYAIHEQHSSDYNILHDITTNGAGISEITIVGANTKVDQCWNTTWIDHYP